MHSPMKHAQYTHFKTVLKRDGTSVPFNEQKITGVVTKALQATHEYAPSLPKQVTQKALRILESSTRSSTVGVENIQDAVEEALMNLGFHATAKAYILYRDKRAQSRNARGNIPQKFQQLAAKSQSYFSGNQLGEFVYLRTYARWIESEKRRETWIETVDRYMAFMRENLADSLSDTEYETVRQAILKQEVMPSMRLMQFSGDPARRCNTCAYNCSFIAPSALPDFAEIMYLSMQGCGVGFSVESKNIEQLPQIKKQTGTHLGTHQVADSKEGWCEALTAGLTAWYNGNDINFDFSLVRPAGARLKLMGGKASGPEPLRSLLSFAREKILARQERRLRPIDAHDIICKIGECVVSGGVRRTAMISLSDLDDVDMRDAKKGQFYYSEPQRTVANNSAVYNHPPSDYALLDEWLALAKSGSGERGIFNRDSLLHTLPDRRLAYLRKTGALSEENVFRTILGTNPCGEIILQSKQFCNLSEVIARSSDTFEDLMRKVRLAALLGTYQATLTNFSFLSPEWKENCEGERLLGVSVTGQWDCDVARDPQHLQQLRDEAVRANAEYAERFGINRATAVTAVKPSGTVSQTFNCSSGIHPRHAAFYVRRIRISATDSLFKMLRDQGIPHAPEVGQTTENATTFVLEFPIKAPDGTTCGDQKSALEQLEYWKNVKLNYTEHNPSATISIAENEWIPVLGWIQKNWDIIGGLSFLPRSNHVYQLAPYEAIDEAHYKKLHAAFPKLNFAKLVNYERTDETEQKKELACAGGLCDIDMAIPPEEVAR